MRNNGQNNKRNSSKSDKIPGRSKSRSSQRMDDYTDSKYSAGYNPDGKKLTSKGSNDPQWYSTDASILRDFASYPFSFATGTPIKLDDPVKELIGIHGDEMVVPGISIQWLVPSIGYTQTPSDPANIAMNSLYSAVRSATSGRKNYDAPDQFLYCLAVASIYSYINWLQRIYGIVTTLYSQGNRYLPQALLEAEGIDYGNLADNVSNFRGSINVMINKVASFAVPSNLNYFRRMAFVYQNVYTEGTSIKDQIYMYSPAAFYVFGLDATGAGQLLTSQAPNVAAIRANRLASMNDLLDYGNALIDAIFADEDIQIIGGDILRAYGNEGLIKLQSLPEVYPMTPIFSIEVLEQMANATVLNHGFTPEDGANSGYITNVTQKITDLPTSPYLQCENRLFHNVVNPTATQRMEAIVRTGLAQSKFLTTTTDKTGPDLVIVNSRLMIGGTNISRDGGTVSVNLWSGTEFVWAQCYVSLHPDVSTGVLSMNREWTSFADAINVGADNPDLVDELVHTLRALSVRNYFKFNSPINQYTWKEGSTAGSVNISNGYLNQAIDNATLLHNSDIQNLHQVALLNLFHVPPISKR